MTLSDQYSSELISTSNDEQTWLEKIEFDQNISVRAVSVISCFQEELPWIGSIKFYDDSTN